MFGLLPNHASDVDKNLHENSNLSKEVDVEVYLHIVETRNYNVNKAHTIRNVISNLFATQEERSRLLNSDNMSIVMVKLMEHTEMNTVNNF